MAGAGYKLFNTGDVLTAAQVNTYLQEQTVMVFANATARTTALSGVLAEGMMSYLQDTNAVEVYDGSAWVSVGSTGDITGVTAGTGISGGGTSGTVTITNTVATTFDAAGDLLVGTGADTWKKLGIGTAGQVLKVNSGATDLEWGASSAGGFVGAYAYKSTGGGSQSIANTTFTVITFDSELFDTDGFHSTTTNTSRMTIPSGKAGKYLIVGRGTFANNATGNRGVRILKNGTLIGEIQTWNAGATYGSSVEITQIADLTVGDYVELASFQSSGGSLNTQNGADYYDALMIQYLGA